MKLKGLVKKEFDKWLEEYLIRRTFLDLEDFYSLPLSMQYGVYVDFFEEKNIPATNFFNHFYRSYPGDYSIKDSRKAAIEKANEIYNNKRKS